MPDVPPRDLGPVRSSRPLDRRLPAWPAIAGGLLGAVSPVATAILVVVATESNRNLRLGELLTGLCVGGSVAFLFGLPAAVTAVSVAPRLPVYPTSGPARVWADFGVAFLAGALAVLTLFGLFVLAGS
ncbi:hypothetical protein [Alienimonas sp. DA493]|uniref:hypothetical protein n=1 Tax=Alienimonas sp. DA493 TaxID=3373605 RepID=UPI003754C634